ncbi:MAG: transglutaminase family protein [Oscillospiraceae bacterium]
MKRNSYRIIACMAALLLMLGTCACDSVQPSVSSSVQTSSESAAVSEIVQSTPPKSSAAPSQPTDTEPVLQESSEPPLYESEEPPESVITDESSQPVQSHTSEPLEQTAPATSVESSAETTTVQTTTATTPEPVKPAEIIIPEVKKPTSPGSAVFEGYGGVLDYSNSSLGYISVSYSGSSDRLKLRLTCNGVNSDHTIDVSGTEYIPLTLGNGEYTAELYERIEGKSYALMFSEIMSVNITDDVGMYLYPNKYCMFERDSKSVAKAAELCAGKSGTVDKLAAIFGWITANVTYDHELASTVGSNYVPNPDYTLAKKTGICFDYASLFAAMLRSQGIPTRIVVGYATDIYHAWNEVWTDETGWITPELLLAKKGYNRLDATFYSSANNKQTISEFITDNGNYNTMFYY